MEGELSTDDSVSTPKCQRTKVQFAVPTYISIPNDLTKEEIEQCWWTSNEVRESRRMCQWIAKESRKLANLSECVDALHILFQEKKAAQDSQVLETDVARRLVRYCSNAELLRGLEYQVCDKLRLKSRKYIAVICRLHRKAGVTDEDLRRVSESHSLFDRILGRILGEADASCQLVQRNHEERMRLHAAIIPGMATKAMLIHKSVRRCLMNTTCAGAQRSPLCSCS